ncbi:MAG: hypothetical protein UR28_C0003G0069 [Candidatus Peregrinibacteria bacterium GW2011_GWF2_33_10]|nr:MAG: hypothetical protein UR28_C0003G0069 [Candidatus Peregrinibacteria bacterium GW2011_GWF2_33_10]OGJ44219.1 MAG: hypothetical protein A2263_04565 [Candidatus Peregrinibacteria bacterium RIFOXYA2_FULL_33_21]OGJ46703.1 MAG: hypothetical protein A2272_04825 [Candidatus Peregrinibacteria bacterium RIFOXYA12_FULL_33_12]OGJ51848.1 MAG: hypothetical protein A2307_05230 [Candidatus Peregrinibacteria bacterium RIFOXYB2_FULL_33_20]
MREEPYCRERRNISRDMLPGKGIFSIHSPRIRNRIRRLLSICLPLLSIFPSCLTINQNLNATISKIPAITIKNTPSKKETIPEGEVIIVHGIPNNALAKGRGENLFIPVTGKTAEENHFSKNFQDPDALKACYEEGISDWISPPDIDFVDYLWSIIKQPSVIPDPSAIANGLYVFNHNIDKYQDKIIIHLTDRIINNMDNNIYITLVGHSLGGSIIINAMLQVLETRPDLKEKMKEYIRVLRIADPSTDYLYGINKNPIIPSEDICKVAESSKGTISLTFQHDALAGPNSETCDGRIMTYKVPSDWVFNIIPGIVHARAWKIPETCMFFEYLFGDMLQDIERKKENKSTMPTQGTQISSN